MHVYINIQLWYEASPSLTQPVLLYRRPRSPESRTARAFRADPPLYPPPTLHSVILQGSLAFTRYCFTLHLLCGRQSSFSCRLPPALPALLQYYCTYVARYDAPPAPPVYAIHYTILVMAISSKEQRAALPAMSRL